MLYLLVCFSALASPVLDASSAYTRGMSSLKQKNAEEAASAFNECLEIDPSRNDCLWELGWAHWLTGDWKGVVTAWETLAERAPKHDPSLQSQLGVARAQANLSQEILRLRELAPPQISEESTGSVRLRAVGDVMLGTDFPDGYLPPDDGAHLLDSVSSLLTDAT